MAVKAESSGEGQASSVPEEAAKGRDPSRSAETATGQTSSEPDKPAKSQASSRSVETTKERTLSEPDKTAKGQTSSGPDESGKSDKTESPQETAPKPRKPLPSTRPPGAPPDPWSVFAATQDKQPGRIRRGLRAALRGIVHEYALVVYAACLLAVMMTWPALRYPMHTLPQDLGDPSRQAWQVSWIGHILISDPVRLWQANAYFPAADGLAFGDSLVGYALAGMIGTGPAAAVLRYNVLFVFAHALLVIGAYALVRQLGARRTGAAVAAVAFAYAPWRLAQEGHLDIISAGGIPLALAMLARGHGYSLRHGFRAERRSATWAICGWLVAIWQLTLGFSLGIPFAYVLGLLLIALMFASAIHSLRGFLRYRRDQKDRREVAALTKPIPDSDKTSLSGSEIGSAPDKKGGTATTDKSAEVAALPASTNKGQVAARDKKGETAIPAADKRIEATTAPPMGKPAATASDSTASDSTSGSTSAPATSGAAGVTAVSETAASGAAGVTAVSGTDDAVTSASPASDAAAAAASSRSARQGETASLTTSPVGKTDKSVASISPTADATAAASTSSASGQKSETTTLADQKATTDEVAASPAGRPEKSSASSSLAADKNDEKGAGPTGGKNAAPTGGRDATPTGGKDAVPVGGKDAASTGGKDAAPVGGKDAASTGGKDARADGKGAALAAGKGAAPGGGKGAASSGGLTDTAVQPAVELAGADVLESAPRKKQSWLRFFRRPTPVPKKPRWKPLIGVLLTNVNIMGATIFAAVGILIAVPYIRLNDSGSRLEEIRFFSPPLQGLLIGPAESRIWGAAHETPRSTLGWAAEMSLLPGFVLYALALAGLFLSIWRLRHRLVLLGGLATAVVLTLGTNFFEGRWTYLPLFGHFPASFDLRIPGRLMLWVTLVLTILAAGAVDDFVRRAEHLAAQRIPPWPGPWLRLATLVPLFLVALEGWNTTAHPIVPTQPAAMRTVPGPMLVLPTAEFTDQTVQLWSTTKFQDMANGGGGFGAQAQSELRAKVAGFPDATSINYLDSIGVRRVLLLSDHIAGTSWEGAGDLPVDNLDIRREDIPGAVVFYLD
ncbi:hypothetical protein Q0Z83_088510 [Actinoplanes sichuanensis]|nr:hypothetical protein Q0Z83_088510 [Actinoplanes sichuanensis]